MPTDHGVGLHEVHGVSPVSEHPLHQDPEHTVAVLDLRTCDGSLENGELMAERDVLKDESLAVLDQ